MNVDVVHRPDSVRDQRNIDMAKLVAGLNELERLMGRYRTDLEVIVVCAEAGRPVDILTRNGIVRMVPVEKPPIIG